MREAKAIAKLSHPNVVGIFDVGVHDGQVFLAMEFLGGGTLRDWVAAKKRPWREIVKMFIEVGQGLAAAHAEGLIHRDFKPDNVLLDKEGKPKVVDFGLVRLTGAALDGPTTGSDDDDADDGRGARCDLRSRRPRSTALTRTGALAGTPAYMAPEQFLGKADRRAHRSVRVLRRALRGAVRRTPVRGRDGDGARAFGDEVANAPDAQERRRSRVGAGLRRSGAPLRPGRSLPGVR